MLEDESIQNYHLNILDIANAFDSLGEKISDEAAEIIAASYMKTLLSLAKKAGKIDDIEVKIPPRWARRALKSGLIDRKKVFLIVIMKTCPVLFSLYCDLRQKLLWLR